MRRRQIGDSWTREEGNRAWGGARVFGAGKGLHCPASVHPASHSNTVWQAPSHTWTGITTLQTWPSPRPASLLNCQAHMCPQRVDARHLPTSLTLPGRSSRLHSHMLSLTTGHEGITFQWSLGEPAYPVAGMCVLVRLHFPPPAPSFSTWPLARWSPQVPSDPPRHPQEPLLWVQPSWATCPAAAPALPL